MLKFLPATEVLIRSDGTAIVELPAVNISGLIFSSVRHQEEFLHEDTAKLLLDYWATFEQGEQ